jgi:hypothetical protein
MCLQFGFVIFWQKDFGAKAAHKMLVKLTPGVIYDHNIYTIQPHFFVGLLSYNSKEKDIKFFDHPN